MSLPFADVRVVEVAAWTFVPGAGAIMADLGADVIKVEPPTGDPQRGLINPLNADPSVPNPFVEVPNRGKRSITINLSSSRGTEVLHRLVSQSDVFLTSYLPRARAKLGLGIEELLKKNPRLIYVRGTGWGPKGPKAELGGFDAAAAWSASGAQHKLTPPDSADPIMQPAAFYDLQGSSAIAGAVAMALFRRERTGEGGIVDVSLLNAGMWTMSPDLTVAASGAGELPHPKRREMPNPIVNYYRTKDGRWLNFVCLQGDRFWAELCNVIGRSDLADDPRFVDTQARFANRVECIDELDRVFQSRTLEEWKTALTSFSGVWSAAATFSEVCDSDQVQSNGYLPTITDGDRSFQVVAPPYQFDETPPAPKRAAPQLGQHTEDLLLETGYSWDDISALHEEGALG